jgi:hypothetical protein
VAGLHPLGCMPASRFQEVTNQGGRWREQVEEIGGRNRGRRRCQAGKPGIRVCLEPTSIALLLLLPPLLRGSSSPLPISLCLFHPVVAVPLGLVGSGGASPLATMATFAKPENALKRAEGTSNLLHYRSLCTSLHLGFLVACCCCADCAPIQR